MSVRILPETVANRIAAGEVVERPASVVKELVENALDAGATRVEVTLEGGGTRRILVADDGRGMDAEDLGLAVERFATSKLDGDDLLAVTTLGFRGEALPSIGSVARLAITTRAGDAAHALTLEVEHGAKGELRPAALDRGTRIEVTELFASVPARLKFLKSERSEAEAAVDVVKRLALTRPDVGFTVHADGRTLRLPAAGLDIAAFAGRAGEVLGRDFAENAVAIAAERQGARLTGLVSAPAYNRPTAAQQYLVVNARPVKDRLLVGALRGAYQDMLPRDRHPAVALLVEVPASEVDVNVHPAKAEVRFRDAAGVRALIVGAIRDALHRAGPRAASTDTLRAIEGFRPAPPVAPAAYRSGPAWRPAASPRPPAIAAARAALAEAYAPEGFGEGEQAAFALDGAVAADVRAEAAAVELDGIDRPLGAAKAQLHDTYVLAQTRDGVVLVDMHAAHERIVYEKLKKLRAESGVPAQQLLVPDVVDLDPADVERIAAVEDELAALGLLVEPFGPGAVLVRATPSPLGAIDARALIADLAEGLAQWGAALPLSDRLDRLASTVACHHSIRAGRRLKPDEMNALLRQIEAEPAAATCNHGRPTHVKLTLADLERLFGRR